MRNDLPPLPQHFFKYRPLDQYTEDVILKNRIFFPSPTQFNDPFDGRIPLLMRGTDNQWRKYLHNIYNNFEPGLGPAVRLQRVDTMMQSRKYQSFENKSFDQIVDSIGVLCLSANGINILMWAHYADAHKGICLRFKPNDEFFLRAQKITYSEPYPTTTIFDDHLARMSALILTKSDNWSYEEEWRILECEKGPDEYLFPPSALEAIIIGCSASTPDIEHVKRLADRSPSKPRVLYARKSNRSFRLEIVDAV